MDADNAELNAHLLQGITLTKQFEILSFESGPLAASAYPFEAAFAMAIKAGLFVKTSELDLSESEMNDLTCLGGLPALETLALNTYAGESLYGFEALSACTNLKSLNIHYSNFDSLPADLVGRLEDLCLCYDESEEKELPDLSGATALKRLRLDEIIEINSIEELSNLSNLEKLTLYNGCSIRKLDPIEELTNLTELRLINLERVRDLDLISGFTNLTFLSISHTRHLKDLELLAPLQQLQKIKLYKCPRLSDISDLAGLQALRELEISTCTQISSFEAIGSLKQLLNLSLDYSNAKDVSFIENMVELTKISLIDCDQLTDLPPLDKLTKLKRFNLNGCTALSDEASAAASALKAQGCTVLLPGDTPSFWS